MNSRMENILETLSLSHRYIHENGEICKEELFDCSFDNAEKVLVKKRAESKKYLENALQD